ncbi:hypothetical protein L249_8834 [Ophiocordyceps polyrhachis-furcata BCC 54312]|uniref:F-box domain-containing protein n=1 Tax=Ophiocordyceps polyrhachis-furcata BCC 54312 TaxID=1330021 RepID=A0A367L2A2_9HYPO|nr:hypothetical protein L249_8834 [Ophiocordyceps polyrhachis-furcata BCC 54312]
MVRFLAEAAALSPQKAGGYDSGGPELALKRGLMRAPTRRGRSMTTDSGDEQHQQRRIVDRQASIPEDGLPNNYHHPAPSRPRLPPPRRSYSATDKEPEPTSCSQWRTTTTTTTTTTTKMTLLDLPSEVLYQLFDHLDPLDGVCFGLAHPRLYAIQRRKHGTVSLDSRYAGPNDMEWAWRGAGPPLLRRSSWLRGQVYCRKCGVSRCELHRHLKGWMGEGYEYCEIRRMFGRPAGGDARSYCFMSSPKKPDRCGRHHVDVKRGVKEKPDFVRE